MILHEHINLPNAPNVHRMVMIPATNPPLEFREADTSRLVHPEPKTQIVDGVEYVVYILPKAK